MTIAAGFVVRDGVLLWADTLFTDTFTKEYRGKIFLHLLKGAAVCFVVAGNSTIAEMAIDDCRDALPFKPAKAYTLRRIKDVIRKIVKRTYEQHVSAQPQQQWGELDFRLLVATVTKHNGTKLFRTERTSMVPVTDYTCIIKR